MIHRFISAESGNPETLLLLHGTGGNEDDLLDLGRRLHPTAALLSPRGNVLENGMPRFFRRLAEGVFDEQDLIARTHELADFVAASCDKYGRDPAWVTAVGFSNGANIAAAMMLLRPEVLRGAVLLRAMVPLEPAAKPDLTGKSALILSGTTDPIVPRTNAERLATLLRAGGGSVDHVWQNSGHGLTMQDVTAAKDWLGRQA